MSNTHHEIARKDFGRKTLTALSKRGIKLVGTTFVPGRDGSFANGHTAYCLDDNGTGRIRSLLEVIAMAGV